MAQNKELLRIKKKKNKQINTEVIKLVCGRLDDDLNNVILHQ